MKNLQRPAINGIVFFKGNKVYLKGNKVYLKGNLELYLTWVFNDTDFKGGRLSAQEFIEDWINQRYLESDQINKFIKDVIEKFFTERMKLNGRIIDFIHLGFQSEERWGDLLSEIQYFAHSCGDEKDLFHCTGYEFTFDFSHRTDPIVRPVGNRDAFQCIYDASIKPGKLKCLLVDNIALIIIKKAEHTNKRNILKNACIGNSLYSTLSNNSDYQQDPNPQKKDILKIELEKKS